MISVRSGQRFRVHSCTGGSPTSTQRKNLQAGVDVLVATPGRLKWLMFEDPTHSLDMSACKSIVFDEVDLLLHDNIGFSIDDIRRKVVTKTQWVFVTATMSQLARQQLKDFEALPSTTPVSDPDLQVPRRGLVWHEGAGLHKVSPACEHVIVDCSPENFYSMLNEVRHQRIMRDKLLALTWHLQYGVLSDSQDDRIVVFCNTIENCRFVENNLRKMDPRDRRSRTKRWKVFVLHGLRHKEVYQNLASEFNGERVKAADFFKQRILVCTDRLSRGIDFAKQRISWVVLFDWPRDASEYLRRAGRTGRGGSSGGVLSLVSGKQELAMSKMITSAAIRGISLQSQNMTKDDPTFTSRFGCLERFNPLFRDWRSPSAATPKHQRPPQPEKHGKDIDTFGQISEMQHPDHGHGMDDDLGPRMTNTAWTSRSAEALGSEDSERNSHGVSGSIRAGVSLTD